MSTKILAEPFKKLFFDNMLGEIETNPARILRTGLLRGRLTEKGDQIRTNMQAVRFRNVSRHALIGSVSEAREVNVVLRLIRAQGRVVRREARTRSCCQIRGVESEADMFDRYL